VFVYIHESDAVEEEEHVASAADLRTFDLVFLSMVA
jgi:hypothetical protein